MDPVPFSGGRRRPRPGIRWGIAALLLTAAVALVAVAGTLGGGRAGAPRGPVHASRLSRLAPAVLPARRGGTRVRGGATGRTERAVTREVERVLHYTAFLTAGRGRRRVVALTFDDGPSPYTGPIVRTLVRMRAPATFFVVGQQLRYFTAGLHDELAHGFTVGDHTLNHALLPRLTRAAQMGQIALDERILRGAGTGTVNLFRPPYGAYDRATLSVLARLHLLMVLWSVDPGDWRRPGARAIITAVLRSARPGAIVILHDGGGDRTQTIAALPAIIRGLRRRGLRLVSVPTLLALDPPPPHQRLPRTIGA